MELKRPLRHFVSSITLKLQALAQLLPSPSPIFFHQPCVWRVCDEFTPFSSSSSFISFGW